MQSNKRATLKTSLKATFSFGRKKRTLSANDSINESSKSSQKKKLRKKDFMVKRDLQDPYFSMQFHRNRRKYVTLQWEGKILGFICLCFGMDPAPRISTKLLNIPTFLMRRVQTRFVIWLDDLLVMRVWKKCVSGGTWLSWYFRTRVF